MGNADRAALIAKWQAALDGWLQWGIGSVARELLQQMLNDFRALESQPVTRDEALRIAREIGERAERERIEIADREARHGFQWKEDRESQRATPEGGWPMIPIHTDIRVQLESGEIVEGKFGYYHDALEFEATGGALYAPSEVVRWWPIEEPPKGKGAKGE